MTLRSLAAGFVAGALVLFPCLTTASAGQAPRSPSGSGLFINYCASCHGPQAKGDGPMASSLVKKPADLTTIAKRNGGKFPADTVFRTIDGRNPVMSHGGQEMPVWGNVFLRAEGGATPETIRARIEALVTYLQSIQQKP